MAFILVLKVLVFEPRSSGVISSLEIWCVDCVGPLQMAFIFVLEVLGFDPRSSGVISKCFITELYSQPYQKLKRVKIHFGSRFQKVRPSWKEGIVMQNRSFYEGQEMGKGDTGSRQGKIQPPRSCSQPLLPPIMPHRTPFTAPQ